jgi:hypothetical protein
MHRGQRKRIKLLWDEYRFTKQFSEGQWWLITMPDPPAWFLRNELDLK